MRTLVVLFIHFIASLARLLGPGGVRSLVAESLLLKHQLLIVNRSRQRSPNLRASDRILAGLMALWMHRREVAAFGDGGEMRAYMRFSPWYGKLPTWLKNAVVRKIRSSSGWQPL